MTSTTVPQIPSGYDEAHTAGWTYHRNGVSGCGFYAKVEDGALHVAWNVFDDDDLGAEPTYPIAASIPLPVLAGIAGMDAVGDTHVERGYSGQYESATRHVVEVADGRPVIHAFDLNESHVPTGHVELAGRVVVVDLIEGEDPRVAAFMLAEVLAGDASTTLRGDNLHDDAVRVARAAKDAASS